MKKEILAGQALSFMVVFLHDRAEDVQPCNCALVALPWLNDGKSRHSSGRKSRSRESCSKAPLALRAVC